jgi:hypothetical protein
MEKHAKRHAECCVCERETEQVSYDDHWGCLVCGAMVDDNGVILDQRPESLDKHVRHTREGLTDTAWCGAELARTDWTFQNVDHVLYHIANQGGVPWCEACLHTIESVASGAWVRSGATFGGQEL